MHQPAPWFIFYRVALRFRKMLRCDKRLRWAIGTWIALMLRNGEHAIRASLPGSKMPGTLFFAEAATSSRIEIGFQEKKMAANGRHSGVDQRATRSDASQWRA